MPSAYANTRSKYYHQLVQLINKYGYKKEFMARDAGIDGRVLRAMYNRGLFDREPLPGKSRTIYKYRVKVLIFIQVYDQYNQEKKLECKC